MNGKAVIQVSPSSATTGTPQNISANLPGPTRRIPVENAGSFSRGNIVRIQWSLTSDWVTENNQTTWWGTSQPSSAIYFREVMATDPAAGWIEVDVPTRYWIKTRDNPTVRTVSGLLRNVAIESLSIGNVQHTGSGWGEEDYTDSTKAAYDTHASWLIRFQNVRDSWIRSVHSYQVATNTRTCHMLSNGILLGSCMRITVQNCQMRRPQYGGGGGNGYMYRLQNSNECLLKNCIADFSRHGFVISHAGTSGNVFHQCEDRETARAIGSSSTGYTTSGSGSDNHMHFSHSNLWDQCHAHNSFYTAHHRQMNGGTTPHGVTSAHAVYWNTSGSGTRYASSSSPIVRSEQLNQGYIIGTKATSGTAYFATNPTGGNTSPADHIEGVNTAATLQPQSLFLDQVSRRLRPTVTFAPNGGSTTVPASVQVIFGETYGTLPATNRPGFIFTGWFTALTGGTSITAATTVANSADHTLHARWNALPSVNAGPDRTLVLDQSLPWSPAMVASAAWFDAADPATITAVTGMVSLWQDKSGNQNHAAQSTASRRPSTGTHSIGGMNVIAFDPFKDQHLAAVHHASLNLDTRGGANLFAVLHSTGYINRGSGLNSILSKGSLLTDGAAYGIRVDSENRLPFKAGNAFFSTPLETFVSQDIIYSGTRSDSTGSAAAFINGLERATATSATISSDNSSALILGGESTTTRCAAVRLGELLILPGAIAAEERQKIEGYLAHKWSLQARLPLEHPHQSSPPLTPAASNTLVGTASDLESDLLTTTWSRISGPAPVIFSSTSTRSTTATFTLAGTYLLRLTASDPLGSRSDDVIITVQDVVPPDPFDQWAGEPESSFMRDSNGDALPDGLAWLLGAASPATSAATVLPIPRQEHNVLSVTFDYLVPAKRGATSLHLQHSPNLAVGTWSNVEIPTSSGTIDGVEFFITPLPGGDLHRIKAVVPAGPSGRVFVRLSAIAPGS
jgi:uncharacterized repeat protein (TIGR02543 family)